MSNLIIRDAVRNDAADLAILDNLASHGISQWFWQGAVNMEKASDAYEWGRARLANDHEPYGWTNSRMAELDGAIAGCANGYIMSAISDDELKSEPPAFQPVMDLFDESKGDWFLDSLAVYSNMQGQGVGRALMEDSFNRARDAGAKQFSLVAEDSNDPALALYHSFGLRERDRRPYIPFNNRSTTQNWLLLSAPLT